MDTTNKYLVAIQNDGIRIMAPPRGQITPEEAVMLAAWLVALADPDGLMFPKVLEAVQDS